jgi:hypothetical protein
MQETVNWDFWSTKRLYLWTKTKLFGTMVNATGKPGHLRFLIGIRLRGPQLSDIIAVSAAKFLNFVFH